MFLRSEETSQPSLVVAEGATFTLSAHHAHEHPNLITNLRPRTTAALLVAAGRPPAMPPRLSDAGAFEHIEKTEGLVNLHGPDDVGRVAGYSVPFLSRLFDVLDPDIHRTPPPTVQWHRPAHEVGVHPCGCGDRLSQLDPATAAHDRLQKRARDFRQLITAPVPDFLIELKVFTWALNVHDIIVERNATLVLDDSVAFLLVRNFLCYQGSRIVQKSRYLTADIIGVLRGSIQSDFELFTVVNAVLKVNMAKLKLAAPTKP
ncbi:MAG: hypothetical protein ACREDD_12160 [Methylocella sp.]